MDALRYQSCLNDMNIRTLDQAVIHKGTRVIVRVDFDVVMERGEIVNDFRVRDALPTIHYLLKQGARVRLVTHIKRPDGKRVSRLSTKPLVAPLAKLFRREVLFVSHPLSRRDFEKYDRATSVLLFENIRFWPGEENNDVTFARHLAAWGDMYVNEAFGVDHRAHASLVALARMLPSYAGLHLAKEISYFGKVLHHPQKPIVMILGGAKLETKLPLIRNFAKHGADVLLGGALANTILACQGVRVGKSLCDSRGEEIWRDLMRSGAKIHVPSDAVVATSPRAHSRVVPTSAIREHEAIYDAGPETVRSFEVLVRRARTVIWNGPFGLIEFPAYTKATVALARALRRVRALKIVGGGETVAVLAKAGLLGSFTHVSSGGGSMLEMLAGERLPALIPLMKK